MFLISKIQKKNVFFFLYFQKQVFKNKKQNKLLNITYNFVTGSRVSKYQASITPYFS